MKVFNLAAMTLGFAALTGCQSSINSLPAGGAPVMSLAPLETKATYEVIGNAQGESTGAVLFGIFKIEGENKSGSISTGLPGMADPVKDAAIYNAIESVPGADSIIAPRVNREVKNYFVYKKETVKVKAKAIRIKEVQQAK